MEKSYELAAKYMGGQNGGQPSAGRTIPRGAVVVGTGKIQGERLDIEITSVSYTHLRQSW